MLKRIVHPGEILKDELAELGVTPTTFAHQIDVPPNRGQPDYRRQALRDWRHRPAVRALVRSRSSILAEPPDAIRSRRRRPASWSVRA